MSPNNGMTEPPGSDPNPGSGGAGQERRVLGGRYELGDVIGYGGMAQVRIGTDLRLGRTVAVKILRSDLANDPTFRNRFSREAQSSASLNHPKIVSVYDTGKELDENELPYIVMEYVEGVTLRQILQRERQILPDRSMEIVSSVLAALGHAHRAGIVHRDIKPGNVMITPAGAIKVMDFGIARTLTEGTTAATKTQGVIGTAPYLSPEQIRGEKADARSDLYATGCLLYELLTGRPPFVGDSPVSVAYQHVREEPSPVSELVPDIPPAADAITLMALRKNPDDRYQSADEMRAELERALAGQRVTAPVPMPSSEAATGQLAFGGGGSDPTYDPAYPDDGTGPVNRRRRVLLAAAAVAVLLISAVGFAYVNGSGDPGPPVDKGNRNDPGASSPTPDRDPSPTADDEPSQDDTPVQDFPDDDPTPTPTPTTPDDDPTTPDTPDDDPTTPPDTPDDDDDPTPTPTTPDDDPTPTPTPTTPTTPDDDELGALQRR